MLPARVCGMDLCPAGVALLEAYGLRDAVEPTARRLRGKAMLCELFQQCINRPWLADSVLQLLARRQVVADSFIGIVDNSYSPVQGFLRTAGQTLTL